MNVLIVSSNPLGGASPSGPAYVAGSVREGGHTVDVFEDVSLAAPAGLLTDKLSSFRPDVVGISIRLVHGDAVDASAPLGTRHYDLRPRVRQIVEIVRKHSQARIVLGGPGFNYYAEDWLEYLSLDYGIRGEGEVSFPLFLQRLAEGSDLRSVPGCVFRKDDGFEAVPPQPVQDWEHLPLPAYDLFRQGGPEPALFTKRGCAFGCTFCPYGKLEGRRYRLKSPERVVAEVRHVLKGAADRRVVFCDNSFNVPRPHAEAICATLIRERVEVAWSTGDLKPVGVTDDFCGLLVDSGCTQLNLAVESASARMLESMKRGYTVRQIRESLEVLSRSGLAFGASLLLGAPGETPETISETLEVLSDYEFPLGVWVTLGVYLWTDYQDIVADARRSGTLRHDSELFSGAVYLSPELPRPFLQDLLGALRAKPGYTVQVNKPSEEWTL